MKQLIEKIANADNIILSTHRSPDGDGLGSEIGLYYALKSLNKKVRLVHVDTPANKYQFLTNDVDIEIFTEETSVKCDLFLVFDTNDGRMIPGLWEAVHKDSPFAFVDHHPVLPEAPSVGELSYINTDAASTGEIVFAFIEALEVSLDKNIAQAIYTSVCFDTQLFRYVKSSARSHEIAAQLIPLIDFPEDIHDSLFGNIPVAKFRFVSHCTNKIEFFHDNQVAYLDITQGDLNQFEMTHEDTRDLTDQILAIDSVNIAVVIAPAGKGKKLSFRSKKPLEVLSIAKKWAGGGHPYASGAIVKSSHESFVSLKDKLVEDTGLLL